MAKETTSLPAVPAPAKATRTRKQFDNAEAKMVHIGQSRTSRALAAIGALKPLGNRKNYGFSDLQREKILTAVETAVAEVREAFQSETPVTGPRFSL